MAFRNRNKQFNRLLAAGMMLLAIAGILRFSLQHHALFSENFSDGIMGMFYGLALGCIFLGFRQNARRCAASK
jgi:hypothetical protein